MRVPAGSLDLDAMSWGAQGSAALIVRRVRWLVDD